MIRPGPRENRSGRTLNWTAAAPSCETRTSRDRISRRDETFRKTSSCSVRQRRLSARSNASEAGLAATSVAVRSRLGSLERDARSDDLGFDAAVEGEPRGREAGDPSLTAVRRGPHRTERRGRRNAAADAPEQSLRDIFLHGDGRDRTPLVETDPAGGKLGAVEENGHGSGAGGV